MERLALSWGNARQFTKLLLSLLSHIGEMVGCHGFAPCSRRLRAGTSLSKFATLAAIRKDRNAKAELNRRRQACEVLTGTGVRVAKMDRAAGNAPAWSCSRSKRLTFRLHSEMVEHQGSAPCIPVWKTGVYLSTPMLVGIPCWNCTSLCGFAGRRLSCSANGI